MKDYWELSELERANLSEEQLSEYYRTARMRAGVLPPEAPKFIPSPDVDIPSRVYYVAKRGYSDEIVFDTLAQAEAFLALKPKVRRSFGDYSDRQYPEDAEHEIIHRQLSDKASMEAAREALTLSADAEKQNELERSRYNEECKKWDAAVALLNDDWQACREKKRSFDRMLAALEEYVGLCDGNRDMAITFLRKAKGVEVDRLLEWHPEWQSHKRLDVVAMKVAALAPPVPRTNEDDTPF